MSRSNRGSKNPPLSKFVPKRIKELSNPVVGSFFVWNRILTTYTSCYLTRDEDKLVAISAAFSPRHLPRRLLESILVISSPLECVAYKNDLSHKYNLISLLQDGVFFIDTT
jgi:hypothetical protein